MAEEYIPTFQKIRSILGELYVAVMWIISQLIIYKAERSPKFYLNQGLHYLCLSTVTSKCICNSFDLVHKLQTEGFTPKKSLFRVKIIN